MHISLSHLFKQQVIYVYTFFFYLFIVRKNFVSQEYETKNNANEK